MKKVLVFDEQGNYIEDKIVDNDYQATETEFLCEISDSIAFYTPKLVNGEVVEGLTDEEIESLKNQPQPLSEIEQLRLDNAESNAQLFEMMLMLTGGGM